MSIKYLLVGPLSASISFIVLTTMRFDILPAIGLSWLVGFAAVAGLIIYQVFRSDEATQVESTGVTQMVNTVETARS